MSHTTTITVELKREDILEKALKELNIPYEKGTFKLFSSTHKGIGVKLPGWKYPVVFSKGKVHYDNYNGTWGDIEELENLMSRIKPTYTKILTMEEISKIGMTITKIEEYNGQIIIEATKKEMTL